MLVAGIIPTLFLVDTWGRRPILILGGIGMVLCLSAVGGLQYHVDTLRDMSPELASAANGIFACELSRRVSRESADTPSVTVVCLYLAFFAFSWGPIPWLIPAEVFPLRARARGMALATGSNWLWNLYVPFVYRLSLAY
jgi:MFS family permease